MAVTFDTLKFVQTLEEAGISREQASAFAAAVRDSHDAADTATKGDLREMELRLRSDMLAMENRLIIKMGAMLVALFGVAAALKLW